MSEIMAVLISYVGTNMIKRCFVGFLHQFVYFREWGDYIQNLFQAVIEVMKSGLKNWEWSTLFHSHFPVHGSLWLTGLKNY